MTTYQVYNLIILDESESMESVKQSIIRGFNKVVRTIKGITKQFPEKTQFISFVTFNGLGVRTHLNKKPTASLEQINQHSYHPGSSAPLYDAIGKSVLELKTDLVGKDHVDVRVTILSDGVENASEKFSLTQIRLIIAEQKKRGWTFNYIGANQVFWKAAAGNSVTNEIQSGNSFEDDQLISEVENFSRPHYSEKMLLMEALGQGFYNFNN